MEIFYNIIIKIVEIGPVIIIPSILFILGLIFSHKFLKTLKNCVFIFIGMFGIAILLSLFIDFFEPLINTILLGSSKSFEVVDIGWLASKEILTRSTIVPQIVLAALGLNLFMFFTRLTRTINIDLWNYWMIVFSGSIVFATTGQRWIGIMVSLIIFAITLVVSDIYAHNLEDYFGVKGLANPQSNTVIFAPVTHLVNTVLNKIPGIRRIRLYYEELQYKLGFFSEPMVIGFILGFLVGIASKYNLVLSEPRSSLITAALSGLELAIIMILLPRLVNLLFKGLSPTLQDIMGFISRKITRREIYLGVDSLIFAGFPSVIFLSVIFIPLTVFFATILPGNNVLPSSDLIIIPMILIWAVAPSKGEIFRSFISALIIIPIVLWLATDTSGFLTEMFKNLEIDTINGFQSVTSLRTGSNALLWIVEQIIRPILNLFI